MQSIFRGPKFWALIVVVVLIFMGIYSSNMNKQEQEQETVSAVPDKVSSVNATLLTSLGEIKLELYPDKAPKTVENFLKLAGEGFYDETLFHRVIKEFMVQGGDPNSKLSDWSLHGTGGPGYSFEDEINDVLLTRGVLAMANSGPNTNGSQFFIVTMEATPWLDGLHTAFGRVVDGGMNIVDKIEAVETDGNDHPLEDIKILGVTIEEK